MTKHPRATSRKPATRPATAKLRLEQLIGRKPLAPRAAMQLLSQHGFGDPAAALATIRRLPADATQRPGLATIFTRLIRACQHAADPQRALLNFERLVNALPNAAMFYHYLHDAPDRLQWLVTVFAHSQALADTLTRDPTYFHFLIAPATLQTPREKAWLDAELRRLLLPDRTAEERYDTVRQFRRRETLRIGTRDLLGKASVEETTLELSNLADVCLHAVYEIARGKIFDQYKIPMALQQPALPGFAVIGMGKLGGQELNYSSDVDVIFVYGDEGEVNPRLSYRELYTKLAEEIIRAVSTATDVGSIFRIDLRLRPEGGSGPLVQSLEGCENYYGAWGETWERMALIKARPVAGDPVVGAAFIQMVQPFVYRRHMGENVIKQMAAIKERIEKEIVGADGLTRHVKLGIGGIREIEFTVQSFQVLRGAGAPALRQRSTLNALPQLVKAGLLPPGDAVILAAAYRFLRNVEHRLQMEMDLQTHTIPDEDRALFRLARSLGFSTVADYRAAQDSHTAAVRKIYRGVLASAAETLPERTTPEQLSERLKPIRFRDEPAAFKTMESLWQGPGFVHVSQRTRDLFAQILPMLLHHLSRAADPDAALARFDQFINTYGSRGLLYELFSRNPKLIEMLVRVSDASGYLSDILVQQPDLFDLICRGAALSEPKSMERMWEELTQDLRDRGLDPKPSPAAAFDAARAWKRGEMLRIGIEDVMGLVDIEQVHQEMSRLAEIAVRFGLATVTAQPATARCGFAVIGLGKLGGQELGYAADLDVLFVTADNVDQPQSIKRAADLMNAMKQRTPAGRLFEMDPRLRPDGEKGPLASSLEAHRRYFSKRALLWERQAMIKARFVAGDAAVGEQFIKLIHETIYAAPLSVAEFAEIQRMRTRIETERSDSVRKELEFKTGPGGLIDVEFLVQALQLRHGFNQPQLRTAHTLAALNRLTALGVIDDEPSYSLRQHYLFLRTIESVLRREENVSISALPADAAAQDRLARRLGFVDFAAFSVRYASATRRIREIYTQFFKL